MRYWGVGFLIFLVDRLTKYGALEYLSQCSYSLHESVRFCLLFNQGISWGMFSTNDQFYTSIMTLCLLALTVCIGWYAYNRTNGYVLLGYTAIFWGSLSNIVDRIFYPGVIDFIALSYKQYTFPLFNIADVAIVAGVFVVLCVSYYNERSCGT